MAEITKDTRVRALTAMLDSVNAQAAREQGLDGWLRNWALDMALLSTEIDGLLNADENRTQLATITAQRDAAVEALRVVQAAIAAWRDGEGDYIHDGKSYCLEEVKYCFVDAAIEAAGGSEE